MEQGGNHSAGFTRPSLATAGFTILETMIVLAVSGILAVSAILLVGGRQNKVEFQTAINDLTQQIQQVINETASGYYPNNKSFNCSANPGTAPSIAAGTNGQGTNSGCLFVGKALRFGNAGGATLQASQYTVYPLMANRYDSSAQEITTYGSSGNANVVPISHGLVAPLNSFPTDASLGTVTVNTTENGLNFVCAWYNGAAHCSGSQTDKIAVFGVLASLGSYTGTQLNSGSQQFSLYQFVPGGIPWGVSTQSDDAVADAIAADPPGSAPLQNLGLCFASGTTTNQYALITIGDSSNGGLGVTLKISANPDCS
jgi:prepilin-type N-terminal cleavage/methylation domain-containing protein